MAMGRREMKPLLLNIGVALFLSFAGFLYTHLTSRGDRRGRRDARQPQSASGVEASGEAGGGRKDEIVHTHCEDASSNVKDGTSVEVVAPPTAGFSPGSKNFEDEEYLLPEFYELVLHELESVGFDTDSPKSPTTEGLLQYKAEKVSAQEMASLKNLVHLLQERIASLEIQLLECYGLKEQESTIRELENHLKINTVEARLLSLKIESLQSENKRLGAQVSNYPRVRAELEAAKANIEHLEMKLRSNSSQVNENVAALHQRIVSLQERECSVEGANEEIEKKLKHLEDEIAALRRENSKLAIENSELVKKLSTQFHASSTLESTEATSILEEVNRLRKTNDELTSKIAQLQVDRCADAEELVYLRWINACLRYELRNYQPPPGKIVARDLSKTLSPNSEEKAKQLILEYANSGINDKSINLMDFDSEYCSSSQASSLTESGEVEDSPIDVRIATKNSGMSKTNFLKKLKKLVLGEDIHHNTTCSIDRIPTTCGTLKRRASVATCSFDEMMDRDSYDSVASCITSDNASGNQFMVVEGKVNEQQQSEGPWTRNLSRVSLDFQKLRSHKEFGEMKGERRKSDVGTSYWQTMGMGEESLCGSPPSLGVGHETFDLPEKFKMKKHSKNTHERHKLHTRSASFTSF